MRFNDDKSAPEIEVRLDDGKRVLLDKDGIVIDDAKGNVLTFKATSGAIEISAGTQLTLTAANVKIEATAAMSVKSSGTLALSGSIVQIN